MSEDKTLTEKGFVRLVKQLKLVSQEDIKFTASKDDLKIFATKDDLKNFSTKDDLKNFATKDDLKNFATKDDLKNFATKDDLKNFATKDDLKNFATKDDLNKLPSHKDLSKLESRLVRQIVDSNKDIISTVEKLHSEVVERIDELELNTVKRGEFEALKRKVDRHYPTN